MTEIKSEKLTPMMKQYFEVKQQYPDTLVFFRLGDFYELFYDDAKIVSNLLDLTLTRRGNQGGEPVPMAGIPFHAADSYIARLLKMGRSIVICEQMVDKQTAGRSMIPRKVSRIITPGTVTDEGMVPERQDNILAAVFADKTNFGFSTLDLSTGRFTTTEVDNLPDLLLYVNKVNPAELLYPERFAYFKEIEHLLCIKSLPAWDFDFETAQTLLCQQFKTKSLSGFDVQGMHAGICAAGALLHYLKSTQTVDIAHITGIVHDKSSNLVLLDKNAQRNLELLSNLNGNDQGSLLAILDETRTLMGSRLLRNMLVNPLRNNQELNYRLDVVEALMQWPQAEELSSILSNIGDLERIVARIGLSSAKPRDLSKLRDALAQIPSIKHLLNTAFTAGSSDLPQGQTVTAQTAADAATDTTDTTTTTTATDATAETAETAMAATAATAATTETTTATAATTANSTNPDAERYRTLLALKADQIPDLSAVHDLLQRAIKEFPSLLIRDGDVIADGYNDELDELRDLQNGSEQTLKAIEEREKQRTGINTLKVSFNNIHGYYIEVSRGAADRVPMDYIRRQTLKNSERYITPELKELEEKTLSAQGRSLQIEKDLYAQILEQLIAELPDLSTFAHNIALLDVLLTLARVAHKRNYTRPTLTNDNVIKIVAGRHPVVEALNDTPFIANSIELTPEHHLAVISGPNMGGKSTYMRQTALIAIMARIGSFVPAKKALIGDIDRIFTRIGASDDLASGRSTFMVEMEESATILNNATAKSLVIMDEVGRGTSGAEGAAIAEAIVQYLAKDLPAKTLFATHYTEVTTLIENYNTAFNLCFNAQESHGKIVFLYKAEPGRQSRSFGIEVAQLAGVPTKITKRAIGFFRARAKELESADLFTSPLLDNNAFAPLPQAQPQTTSNSNNYDEQLPHLADSSVSMAPQDQGEEAAKATTLAAKISALEAQVREEQARAATAEAEMAEQQELMQSIKALNLDTLTPLEALNTLHQLKAKLTAER